MLNFKPPEKFYHCQHICKIYNAYLAKFPQNMHAIKSFKIMYFKLLL